MRITIQMTQESDLVWRASALESPEVEARGESPQRAAQKVQALALRRLAERLEGDDFVPVLEDIAFDMPYFEPVAER